MAEFMHIRHKATGKTALGQKAPDGCVRVQFDDLEHPQAYGWHLYPRHHFVRTRTVKPVYRFDGATTGRYAAHNRAGKQGLLAMKQIPLGTAEAKQLREAFLEQHPEIRDFIAADFSELERRYEEFTGPDGKIGMRPRRTSNG